MANPNNPFADIRLNASIQVAPPVQPTPARPTVTTADGQPTAMPQRSSPRDKPIPLTAEDMQSQAAAAFAKRSAQSTQDMQSQADKAFADRTRSAAPYAAPGLELMRGFNRSVADLIAAPAELVESGLRAAGLQLPDHPGDATAAIRAGFQSVGIDVTETDSMLNKIGAHGLQDTLMSAVILAGAPAAAAYTGGNWLALTTKGFAEYFNTAPGKATLSWLTSGAGATLGGEAATNAGLGPAGQAIGALGGALAGGGTALGINKAAEWVTAPFKYIGRSLSRTEQDPIKPFGQFLPERAVRFAQDQIAGDIARTDTEIKTALASIPRTGMPEDISGKAFSALLKAKDYSESVENAYWARVPKDAKVPQDVVRSLEDDARAIEVDALKNSPRSNPEDMIKEIRSMGAGTRAVTDPNTGRVIRNGKPISIERLLGMHSDIRGQIRADRVAAARGDKSVSQRYVTSMEQLDTAVLDAIAKVLPDDVTLAQAREYTRTQASMFQQGMVGRVLAWRQTGDPAMLPEQVGPALFRSPMGAEQARNAEEFAANPPFPVSEGERAAAWTRPHQDLPLGPSMERGPQSATGIDILGMLERTRPAPNDTPEILAAKQAEAQKFLGGLQGVSATEQPGSFGVQSALEDYIRASFREAGDQGVEKAQAFIEKNQGRIKYFAGVADELNTAGLDIAAIMERKVALEKSALAKFTGADPKVAIASIFSAKDPRIAAENVLTATNKSPEATAGLRAGMIDWLADATAFDPRRMADALKPGSHTRGAFEAVFPKDKLTRLDRVVALAVEAQKGTGFKVRHLITGPTVFAMKILGTMFGRSLNTGTIQVPGYMGGAFAQMGRQVTDKVFSWYSPSQLLRNAIEDPKWEKFLYARVPSTPQEVRDWTIQMRRMVYTTQAAEEAIRQQFRDDRK